MRPVIRLSEKSLDAIKSVILLAAIPFGFILPNGIAKQIWGLKAGRMEFLLAALPFIMAALMTYWFYLRRPHPSRYGHGRNLLGSQGMVRTHPRDMLAMVILGLGSGAFTTSVLFWFDFFWKRVW